MKALRQFAVTISGGMTASSAPPKRDPEEHCIKNSSEYKAVKMWPVEMDILPIVEDFVSEVVAGSNRRPQLEREQKMEEDYDDPACQ